MPIGKERGRVLAGAAQPMCACWGPEPREKVFGVKGTAWLGRSWWVGCFPRVLSCVSRRRTPAGCFLARRAAGTWIPERDQMSLLPGPERLGLGAWGDLREGLPDPGLGTRRPLLLHRATLLPEPFAGVISETTGRPPWPPSGCAESTCRDVRARCVAVCLRALSTGHGVLCQSFCVEGFSSV